MSGTIYTTFIERENCFIKIWGQMDKNISIFIENALLQMKPDFDAGVGAMPVESLTPGLLCCAKFKDESYYRARITNITMRDQGIVEVIFIDYGNRDFIQVSNIRSISNFPTSLISIPAQAKDFILAKVQCLNNNFNDPTFEVLSNEIRYLDFQFQYLCHIGQHALLTIASNGQDIAESFAARNLALPIELPLQQLMLQGMLKQSPVLQQPPMMPMKSPPMAAPMLSPNSQPNLLTFKSLPLPVGSEHTVYVSYVTDGPCLFSIQLQKKEAELQELMVELNELPLVPLEEMPLPGCVCLARSLEDNIICRAVVTNMVDDSFKVFFVDFGNTEISTFDNIYQIPFKYVIPKVMAKRFALAGLQGSVVSLDMKVAFKEFVTNKVLQMRVASPSPTTALSLCELWDSNGSNVLEFVRGISLQGYPDPVPLARGVNQEVKVSYVFSCLKFYVQLRNKEDDLNRMMNELQQTKMQPISEEHLRVNGPCIALYEADSMYYRAVTLDVQNGSVLVRYVDYGNEETIPIANIKAPIMEFITNLRPQAIECCLNGYQNMEKDQERDNLLEEILLEQYFMMKVGDVQGTRILVDLFDSQQYNVASVLLDKLAKIRSQISPPLVQEFNKIDQRNCKTTVAPTTTTTTANQYNTQRESKTDSWRDKKDNKPRPTSNDWRNNKQTTFENSRNNSHPRENTFDHEGNNDFRRKPRDNNSWGENRTKDTSFDSETSNHSNEYRRNKPRGGDSSSWSDRPHRSERNNDFKRRSPRDENSWGDNNNRHDRNNRSGSSGFGDNSRSSGFGDNSRSSGFGSNSGDNPRPRREHRQDFGERGERHQARGDRHDRFNRRDNKSEEGGSEKSWSGKNFKNKFDPKSEAQTKDENIKYAELTTPFGSNELLGTEHTVSTSWFYNPSNFYCQIEETKGKFDAIMHDIQRAYRNRKPLDTVEVEIGNSVIALFPEDKALYRAIVMEKMTGNQKVLYVDFGNTSMSNKIFKVEERFMELPAQAVQCSLLNVDPVGDKWPKADSFHGYFGTEKLKCRFDNAIDSNYVVELSANGKSVKDELQKAGLILVKNPYEKFDINYLVAQQIYCKVDRVTTLGDFALEILPGLFTSCAIFKHDSAVKPDLELLKSMSDQMVVAYIDEVQESRIFVTLYDMKGKYIPAIELQEEMFETVNAICPAVIIGPYLTGYVSHASGNSVFVQPDYIAKNMEAMLEHLFECYDTTEPTEFEVLQVIYAVKSPDGNWYRGMVTKIEDNAVTVRYIDYGNSETVEKSALRILFEDFFTSHMAIEITLENGETYLDQEVNLKLTFENDVWIGQVVDTSIPTSIEAIQKVPIPETQELQQEPEEVPVIPTEVQLEETPAVETEEEEPQQQTPGFSVQLSHLDNPGQFYLQQSSALDAIDQLQDELQPQIEKLTDVETVTTGIICAAPYSADSVWYRAQVLDADSDITTVRFIDYGNTDVLGADMKIKTLPAELLSLEEHAKRCSLYLSPASGEWTSEACKRFEDLTNEAALTAEIVHQDGKTTFVKLYANDVCINELFVNEKYAIELELETSPSTTGFVSHLNSPSEFWIQYEHACNDLEWIADQLTNAEKFKQLNDHAPGSLCAAVFPDDESWYRARILSNTVAGIEVLFIDYGNSCTCTSLRELPEELVMVPALAHKCSLLKPEGLLEWPLSATDKFKEISAEGVTVFTVIKHSQGETNQVQLVLNQKQDISQILTPQLFDATIVSCSDMGKFAIRKCESNETFDQLQKDIADLTETPTEEEVIVAALHENTWYRCKIFGDIVGQYVVELIDVGIEVDVRELRQLPKELAEIEALAIKVKMNPVVGFAWGEDGEVHFRNMFEPNKTIFQVEQVTDQLVRLYLNGHDVRMHIPAIKATPASSVHSTPKKELSHHVKKTEEEEVVSSPILLAEQIEQTSEFDMTDDVTMKTIEITKDVQEIVKEISNTATDTVLIANDENYVTEKLKKVTIEPEEDATDTSVKPVDASYLYHSGLAVASPTKIKGCDLAQEDNDKEILKDAEMIASVTDELVERVAEQCMVLDGITSKAATNEENVVNCNGNEKEENEVNAQNGEKVAASDS